MSPFLSAPQRRTLERLCDTLVPALEAENGEDPRLFGYGASAAGLAEALEPAIRFRSHSGSWMS